MASTYDIDDYDSDEEKKEHPEGPPRENLLAAAAFTAVLFRQNDVDYAAMGGFAMICRGSTRSTRDVDVVIDTSMSRIWDVITPQPRLRIPNKKLVEGVVRVFVQTGPSQKDPGCSTDYWVEVDLISPGCNSAPRNVAQHKVQLEFRVGQLQQTFQCLDVVYMMRGKVNAAIHRKMAKDVADVLYLLDNNGPEIAHYRDQLNKRELDEFLSMSWTEQVHPKALETYKEILGRNVCQLKNDRSLQAGI